jgi:hypothetical protein
MKENTCKYAHLSYLRRSGSLARAARFFGGAMSWDGFDPIATVVDWFDACSLGDLNTLIALYDERALLECDCEGVSLTGRTAIAAYWHPKLQTNLASAFRLDGIALDGDGVRADCRNHEGRSVRIQFRFNETGRILHMSCEPLDRSAPSLRVRRA